MCPDPNDSTDSVNFKRGILSSIHTSIPSEVRQRGYEHSAREVSSLSIFTIKHLRIFLIIEINVRSSSDISGTFYV